MNKAPYKDGWSAAIPIASTYKTGDMAGGVSNDGEDFAERL